MNDIKAGFCGFFNSLSYLPARGNEYVGFFSAFFTATAVFVWVLTIIG